MKKMNNEMATRYIFHGGSSRKLLRLWQDNLHIRGQINYGI